jgi:glycosyltransferase involved in cell wall biosynthesis
MKILVVTTSFPTHKQNVQLGGTFILTECLSYEQAGAKVVVVTPGLYGVPDEEIFGENIHVKRFSYFLPRKFQRIKVPGLALYQKINWFFYLQLPFFLLCFAWKVLRNGKNADIVHSNWTLSAFVSLPLKWFYGIPIVLTSRGSDVRLIPKFFNTFIINNLNALIDCFGPYPEMLALKKDFPAHYITLPVIVKEPPDILPEDMLTKDKGTYLIVFIGRFDQTKAKLGFGFFTLLDAVKILHSDYNVKCIYVGDGPLKNDLIARMQQLHLEDVVEFVGHQENVYPYIEAADLVVGGCALNAVAQEACLKEKLQLLPTIEMWQQNLWEDKENCLLYETGNPHSIAKAIEYAIAHPSEINKLVVKVKEMSKKYLVTGKKGGEIYLNAFQNVIDCM